MAGIGIHGVWHFSFTVADLERSLAFYVGLLAFDLVHRQIQDNAYTRQLVGHADARLHVAQLAVPRQPRTVSTHDLELVQYERPVGRRGDIDIANPGAAHLALTVTDIAAWYGRLASAGVHFVSPPNRITAGVNEGGYAVYFHDPDEIVLELVQPPPNRDPVALGGSTP